MSSSARPQSRARIETFHRPAVVTALSVAPGPKAGATHSVDRRIQLFRFINFYNTVKPHKSLNNATPYEILNAYFNQPLRRQP
ncbi:integrase core domain-containing protein [Nitrosomonas sp.]|uniref:integrase core domain-containing protein n=1 Tax=Nitrosomonas sp. TaxID=42353 RepID=UPI003A5BAF6A